MDIDQIIEATKPSQNTNELKQLFAEVQEIQPLTILEVGVAAGGSMRFWREVFDPASLIGIDQDSEYSEPGAIMLSGDSHSQTILNQLKRRLDDSKVDFLFIDGDHSLEGVRQDFATYGSFVREGGIIAFHDICVEPELYPGGEMGVKTFWRALKWELKNSITYNDWDYKEFWDEAGQGTGTGVVYVGTQ